MARARADQATADRLHPPGALKARRRRRVIAPVHAPWMVIRETAATRGARRARLLRARLAQGLADVRQGSGLSVREVARQLGVSHDRILRAERGEPGTMTIDLLAGLAAVLGRELNVSIHPVGAPVRDKGHLALLARFRTRLNATLRWRTEVPVPITGDRRSADGTIDGADFDILVEVETHLYDVQEILRDAASKQRDLGMGRLILLLSDTRHNREVVRRLPELRDRFPVPPRACLAALRRGEDPGGDSLLLLWPAGVPERVRLARSHAM